MKPIDKLIDLLIQDKVIPVIGAGFSYAVAKLPGWKTVIENGLDYADQRKLIEQTELSEAREMLDSGQLVKGANIMKRVLNAPNHPFSDWVKALFENPVVVSDKLIHSVNDLCTPFILTTNYDDLLYSKSLLRTKVIHDWSEHQETARAIKKKTELILHLHGVYGKPETIILSEDDYTMLSGQAGYKAILQKLWTDYHFLFIGCSRDGVMDEDFSTVFKFLNQWFPSVPHEHFILFQDSEFAKGVHKELAKVCNIHPISYGNNHDGLPDFINRFNPNKEKLKLKLTALEQELKVAFERELLLPSGELTGDETKIGNFLKENLPRKIYWIDSVQLKILEQVLQEHNQKIESKREQFRSYQAIMKGLASVSALDEKVDLWKKNRTNAKALNNDSFINLAELAYECLNRMPRDLMDEIRHRSPTTIHRSYFNGHLGSFVKKMKDMRERGHAALYDNDPYMFENLKRIIDSLSSVLRLNPDKIFSELPPSNITDTLVTPFLVFVSDTRIAIRQIMPPYEEIASLDSEQTLPFKGASVVKLNDQYFVITYNSQQCMRWDPTKDIAPIVIYTAAPGTEIWSVIIPDKEPAFEAKEKIPFELMIDLGYSLVKLKDYEVIEHFPVDVNLMSFCYFRDRKKLIGVKSIGDNQNDYVIYDVQKLGNCVPLLSKKDIWNMVKNIPGFAPYLNEELEKTGTTYEKDLPFYPPVRNFEVRSEKLYGKEIMIMDLEVDFSRGHTVLIGLDIYGTIPAVLFSVLLPYKHCVAFSFIHEEQKTDLLCGYLSIGDYPERMLEYITEVSVSETTFAKDRNIALPRNESELSDINFIILLSENRALAIQNSKTLYDIELPDLTFIVTNFESIKTIIPVI